MWFNKNDISISKSILLDDLHGYVLPHASTTYTGDIISKTLRFRTRRRIMHIYVVYYPSKLRPNVGKYFHEFLYG